MSDEQANARGLLGSYRHCATCAALGLTLCMCGRER